MNARMKARLIVCVALVAAVISGCRAAQSSIAFPEVRGEYLGQLPPGSVPQLFAPDVFREEIHSVPVFSVDGNEVYWGPMDNSRILYMRQIDDLWTPPESPGFSVANDDSPVFSPDGDSLFFISWRGGGEDIWRVDRTDDGWSSPVRLPQTINSLTVHWQIAVADSGDLYFGARSTEAEDQDIYRAVWSDGQYSKLERLGDPISTDDLYEHSPFIARDGSYLLFTRLDRRLSDADLYVSFKNPTDSSWGPALRFGAPINTAQHDQCPWVSPDGKYLFFLSFRGGRSQVYWVDAAVIEDMRPK